MQKKILTVQVFNENRAYSIPCKIISIKYDPERDEELINLSIPDKFLNLTTIKNANSVKGDPNKYFDPNKITFNEIISLPLEAMFVFAINKQIMEFFTWDLKNNHEASIQRISNLFPHLDDAKQIIALKKAYDEDLKDHETNATCKTCIGEINRKYISKLIPFFHSYEDNVILVDIENIFNNRFTTETIEAAINIPELKNVAKQYKTEMENAINNKKEKCTTCTLNKIKSKYLDVLKDLLNKGKIDKSQIPQGLLI